MKKENIKKYEYVRNGIRICLKKKSKNKENMENNTEKMFFKEDEGEKGKEKGKNS